MKVSIIIPVYNVCCYLEKCVSSVLELKCNIEVILVDDGSTDGSSKLCDLLAEQDRRIVVIHQENGGLSCARNRGIKESSGTYLMFLDADDFFDSKQTDELLECLQRKPQVLMGLYQNYYGTDRSVKKENSNAFFQMKGEVVIDEFLHAIPSDGTSCYMIAWRFIVQRELILKNALFFCQGIYHEDEEWTSRLLCTIDSIYVSHYFFYQYRQEREGSITSKVGKKHIVDCLFIIKRMNSFLKNGNLNVEKKQYLQNRMAQLFLNILLNLYILSRLERKQLYRDLRMFQDTCVSNMSGRIGNPVRVFIKIFGIRMTAFLLMSIKKMKIMHRKKLG